MSFVDLISSESPVLLYTLSHLESLQDVQAGLYVCKAWNQTLNSDAFGRLALSHWHVSEGSRVGCSAWKCLIHRPPVSICCLVSWEGVLLQNDRTTQGLVSDLLLLSGVWRDLQTKPSSAAAFLPVLLGKLSNDSGPPVKASLPVYVAAGWASCPAEAGAMARLERPVTGQPHSLISNMRRISQCLQPAQLDANDLWKALCRTVHHLRFCRTFQSDCSNICQAVPPFVCGTSKHDHLSWLDVDPLTKCKYKRKLAPGTPSVMEPHLDLNGNGRRDSARQSAITMVE